MKEKIIELLKQVNDNFFITPIGENKSIIMLVFPYEPFELLSRKEYAQLDAYYFISNTSYHTAKIVCKRLEELGVAAQYNFDFNYKQLALKADYCGVGKNTLCYTSQFGSRFVMQAILINGELEYTPSSTKIELNCNGCNLCKNACPTGAISNDAFDATKCLRYLQEFGGFIGDETAKKMQNKLLGCDICQAVCPYNKLQTRVKVNDELKEFLKLENLLELLSKKENIKEHFLPKIGKNYAREKMILPNLMLVCGNSSNPNLIKKLEFFVTHQNKFVSKNAVRSIEKITADKKE